VVTRIDRLARSLRDLQNSVHDLRQRGVALKATEQPIDTSTAAGKCFLDMLGVLPRSRPISGASSRRKASGWPRRTAFTGKGRPASIDVARVRELKAQGKGALTQSPRLSAYTGRASIGCWHREPHDEGYFEAVG